MDKFIHFLLLVENLFKLKNHEFKVGIWLWFTELFMFVMKTFDTELSSLFCRLNKYKM